MGAPIYQLPNNVRGMTHLPSAMEAIQSNFERLFKALGGLDFTHGVLPPFPATDPQYLTYDGTEAVWDKIDLTNGVDSGPLSAANGGTGLAAYAVGDLLYASAATTLNRLADVATGAVLRSGGVGAAPAWTTAGTADQVLRIPGAGGSPAFGAVDLAKTAAVTGILDETNGGTGASAVTTGDLLYGSSANVWSRLPIAASVNGVLRSTGTIPSWTSWGIASSFAQGDLLHGLTSNNIQPLTIGSAGKILRSTGTVPAWSSATFPLTAAAGDLLYGSALNTWTALTVGTANKILASTGTIPGWIANIAYGALPTGGGTWTLGGSLTLSGGALLFSLDNANDIGASGATRPRDLYLGRTLYINDTKIMKTTTTFTDGAGVAAGTLLNAPVAGNPTKWIQIDDNGTPRYIPAW